MNIPHIVKLTLAGGLLLVPAAHAADDAELRALRDQVALLKDQLSQLERRIDAQNAKAPAPAGDAKAPPAAGKVTATDQAYGLASGDGANSIRLRGLVQLDNRQFFDDGGLTNNAFVMRRVRLFAEGTFARDYSFQIVPEFGGSAVTIHEANFAISLNKSLQVRFGRMKEGIGLERLQSDSWTFLNERSVATNLIPDRDLGVQVSGKVLDGRIDYALGVFNGLPDGASSNNTDYDNDKDVAGRIFTSPFRLAKDSALKGLSFGVGGSLGRQQSTSGRTSGYRTDGQQVFFSYSSGVLADGEIWRLAPQLDYRAGPFGMMAEYNVSSATLRPSAAAPTITVRNKAWHVGGGYVLTGEDSTFNGVTPRRDFNWEARTWGAWELTARAAKLDIDSAAFPLLASPATSARYADSFGAGVNWYLSKVASLKCDFYHTRFGFAPNATAPTAPVLRQNENVLITRAQLSF